MKRQSFSLLILTAAVLVLSAWSWAVADTFCPEAPNDNGLCDTLRVTTPDAVQTGAGPWYVRFPLWITHDITITDDSLAAIIIPLCYTKTNPAKYCSVSAYMNQILWGASQRLRSVFRHLVVGSDTTHNWMMDRYNEELGEEWNGIIIDLTGGTSHFWLTMIPTGSEDVRFGTGNHTLIATMTFKIQDTMHVSMDTCLWPPSSNVAFARADGPTYVPRDNMPATFWIGPPHLQVLIPNGGETWLQGTQHNITWLAENFDGTNFVKIELSTNSGGAWSTVIASTPNNGTYLWTVPSTPSGTCLIQITNTAGATPTDQSDENFAIYAPPTPDFSIAATPDTQTVAAGQSTSYTVNLGAINGFNNPVTLSMIVIGASTGITSDFVSSPVTPPGSATMNVHTTTSTAVATYKLEVTGTYITPPLSPALVHRDTVTLIVTPVPDFIIDANPDTQQVISGNGVNYNVILLSQNGFSNPCTLTTSALPSGVSANFSINPVTPSDTVIMAVSTTLGVTPAGTYKITITGTEQNKAQKSTDVYLVVKVPDFTIDATPDTQQVISGNGVNYDVILLSQNSFSNPCTLTTSSLPSGVSVNFSINPVIPSDTVVMTLSTTYGVTQAGTYQISITATEQTKIQKSTDVYLVVKVPDFTIDATPESLMVRQGEEGNYNVALTSINGFSSACTLTVTGLPANVTGIFTPPNVTPNGSSTLAISPDLDAVVGKYTLIITGTKLSAKFPPVLSHSDTVLLDLKSQKDFDLTAAPETLRIELGEDSSYKVKLTSLNGFNAPCSLSVSGLPTNVTGSFNSHILTPTDSTLLNIMVSCSANTSTVTPYTLTITATELSVKGIVKTKQVYLFIDQAYWGFKFATSPDSQKAVVGDSAIYQILIRRTTCFTLACSLAIESGLPSGASYYFSPPFIPSSDSTSKLVVKSGTAPAGRSNLIITGLATAKAVKDTLILVLQDFEVSSSPDTAIVTKGQSAGYNITLTSLFGFADHCTLMVSGLPNPPNGVFDKATLIPTDNTSLTIYTTPATDTGWHDITITARRMVPGKINVVLEHSHHIALKVNEGSDVNDGLDNPNIPKTFALFQNQPNPFNPTTEISYYLPKASQVRLTVYNVLGQSVRILYDGYQEAGTQNVTWDGKSSDGNELSSGIYFYRLQAGDFNQTKKMSLMK